MFSITVATILTSIASLTGGALGFVKNAVEMRSNLTALFKTTPTNPIYEKLGKDERQKLSRLSTAIEIGKELANRIYKKMAINYLFTGLLLLFVLFFAFQIILAVESFSVVLRCAGAIVLTIAGYFIFTVLLGDPTQFKLRLAAFKEAWEALDSITIWDEIKTNSDPYVRTFIEQFDKNIYSARNFMRIVPLINKDETAYLSNYLQLCALKDTFEVTYVNEYFDFTRMQIFESSVLKDDIQRKIATILIEFLQAGQNISANRSAIEYEFNRRGLSSYLDFIDQNFYTRPYDTIFHGNDIEGIVKEVKSAMGQYYQKVKGKYRFE